MPDAVEVRTPGQLIRRLLEERGWSQRVLAVVMKMSEPAVNLVVADKRDIDAEMALLLGQVFVLPAERFLDLQKSYDLARARLSTPLDPTLPRRAALFGALPVGEMIKRGWVKAKSIKDLEAVEVGLAEFFGVASADQIDLLPHAAKKTEAFGPTTPAQLAWLYRVKRVATEQVVAARFSGEGLVAALERLNRLLGAPEEARHVPRILSEAGVRFVIVETLPKAKIDGVCLWLGEDAPVIGISLRHDRIDSFWFVLRHEIEHVLNGDGLHRPLVIDSDLEGSTQDLPEQERVANEAAADFCVPKKEMASFILRKQPFFAERDIVGFAGRLNLHPGLVAGQLRHKLNRWDLFSKHLAKIRFAVAPSATVDGWGDVAPLTSKGTPQ
jgi:HTH-type transcriptional regulator/antitoxin HigA